MKPQHLKLSLIIALAMLMSAACTGQQSEKNQEISDETVPVYTVKGRFIQFNEENMTISVVHEEIPGVMRSMRMNLRLDNPGEAAALEPGDIISFQLTRRGASWFVYDISVLPDDTMLDLPEDLRDLGT